MVFLVFMKQSLALLLAYLFFQVQIWAFAPVYPSSPASLTGTWAGTLIGQVFFDANGNTVTGATSANGLGVFMIGQPDAGLGSGVFAMFAAGVTFTGAVIAITDPGELTMSGVMEGSASFSRQVANSGNSVTITVVEGLLGISFQANIVFNQASNSGGATTTRITGTGLANFQGVDPNTGFTTQLGSTDMVIDGFLQSNQVTGTVNLNTLSQTQGTGGA
jgi:hypothetical protein